MLEGASQQVDVGYMETEDRYTPTILVFYTIVFFSDGKRIFGSLHWEA
jgi:hypothetical protein